MLRIPAGYLGLLLLPLLVARPAAAQAPAAPLGPAALPAASFAPTLTAVRFGLTAEADARPADLNASAARMSRREGRILALVGGAAVITGILIGGDAGTVIAIGGAGIGLYGLYVWQR
jgi:hypothetical protein